MAWYKTGTVSVTNASTTVTGSGTNFVSGAQVGEAFYGPDDDLYEITAISSATSLTITPAYGGSTASGQSYAIVPTQSLVADLASDVADLISDYQTIADEAGAGKFGDGSAASPSIKFTQDQDTGFFRDTANEIAISAGGSKIGSFTANGLEFLDNEKAIFGTGSDFSIYHNGSNTFLEESGTGTLVIRSNTLNIQNASGTETMAQFIEDGAVTLRYDNEIKLQTTANGVNFTAETVGITGTTGSTKLQITSTDDGAGDGPLLQLFRDSSTPAASDNIARIDFLGENSTGGQTAYARIDTFIQDPTAGSEQGRMRLLLESEGAQRSFIEMDASAGGAGGRTWINSGQVDIDFRVSGDTEANLLYVDASTDRIGVGTGTPSSVFHVQDSKPSADLVYFNQTTTVGADVLRLNTQGTGSGTNILDVQSNSVTKFLVRGDGNVGIGTSSPSALLDIDAGSSTGTHLEITTTGSGHNFDMVDGDATARLRNVDGGLRIIADNDNEAADSYIRFDVDGEEAARIDSSGNVGIGTSSPSSYYTGATDLVVSGSSDSGITVASSTSSYGRIHFSDGTIGDEKYRGYIVYSHSDDSLQVATAASERMRIDSSGNLLVGRTSTISSSSSTDVGHDFRPSGVVVHYRDSGPALFLGRQGTDGDIALFYKSGSPVGSIKTTSYGGGGLQINNSGTELNISLNNGGNNTGNVAYIQATVAPWADNYYDLGKTSYRWDDVRATNGTIQTSDRNEKQQIASLTDAEITAAKAISKLFKTFKWNDRVAEKGDAARTHSGVIAQDVEQAMTDAGLDAGDYAFFISDTWWETQTEVPAVEADEENGVEAQEAYTRTDTYDTAEEAPEGATERNRKGIRYPELLSFIGAATEQRLASIETRLDALEA